MEPRKVKFREIVDVKKVSNCPVCSTYNYTFKYSLTKEIAPFLEVLGALKYPLEQYTIIHIDNEYFSMTGNIGRSYLKVKYKQNKEQGKRLFDMQMASYFEKMLGIIIEFD